MEASRDSIAKELEQNEACFIFFIDLLSQISIQAEIMANKHGNVVGAGRSPAPKKTVKGLKPTGRLAQTVPGSLSMKL